MSHPPDAVTPRLSPRRLSLVAALLLAGASAQLAAQSAAPAGSFLESLGVRLVEVGVVVTDKSGAGVAGLTVADFELREDGKKVEITHFQPPRHGAPPADAARVEPAGAPTRADAGFVVLLVDNLAIDPQSRKPVLDGTREFVERHLDSGLRFAVASYDGFLNVRQTFTGDREELLAALASLERLDPLGLARRADRWAELRERFADLRRIRDLQLDPAGDSPARYLNAYTAAVRAYADRVGRDTGSVFFAMSHMINALGALPGSKALVYVGEGLPMRPGEEFLMAASNTLQDLTVPDGLEGEEARQASVNLRSAQLEALSQRGSQRTSTRGRGGAGGPAGLEQLTALANASRVSIYSLKSNSYAAGGPPELSGVIGALYTPELESVREQNLLETLQVMAAATGGEARVGGGIDNLLERARTDLEQTYVLAFMPDRPADNRFHELQVKVKRKKVDVRARSGYVDKGLGAKLADRATTSLLLGIDDNPHGLRLEVGRVRPGPEKGQVEVALVLHVPMRHLQLIESGGVYSASTQLFLAARDDRGEAAPVQAMGLRIETDQSLEENPEQTFSGQLPLVLRSQPQRVGLGFVDPATGMASFVSADLDLS